MKIDAFDESPVNIIFLSASSGGGHHAVAQSLSKLISSLKELNGHTIDLYADKRLQLYPKVARMRAKLPWMWIALLVCTDNRRSITTLWRLFKPSFVRSLKKQLDQSPVENPDIIIATHHASAQCLAQVAERYAPCVPKTVVFVTDYDVHQNWIAEADLYVVASEKAYLRLLEQGKPVLKTPLLPCVSAVHDDLNAVRKYQGHQGNRFRFIAIMGLDGTSEYRLHKLLDKLDSQLFSKQLCIDIVCGKNKKLQRELLQKKFDNLTVNVFGYVEDLPTRLAQADMALLRLSPQIMTESLAARTPVIAFDWHFHERENINLLREFGAGDGSRYCDKQVSLIKDYCQNSVLRERWQKAASQISERQVAKGFVATMFRHLNESSPVS